MKNLLSREVKVLSSPDQLKTSGIYVVKSEIKFPMTDAYLVDFNEKIEHCDNERITDENRSVKFPSKDNHYGLRIAENVTLIFEGGCFAADYSNFSDPKFPKVNLQEDLSETSKFIEKKFYLIGKHTVLKAGAEQIFGDGLEVTGPWITDRSYPQWFDQLAGKQKGVHAFDQSITNYKDLHDCSEAINKAIRLKGVGEVFLPTGNYYICHPIKLPIGITLVGETYRKMIEGTQDEQLFKIWNEHGWFLNDTSAVGSIIIPFIEYGKDSTPFDRGIFRINLADVVDDNNKDGWVIKFPLNVSSMKDLAIFNILMTEFSPTKDGKYKNHIEIARKVCCEVAGGYTFQNVRWYNFPMAVKWTEAYTDLRKINDCSFWIGSPLEKNMDVFKNDGHECMYMINIPFLGDALQITHSQSDTGSPKLEVQKFFKWLHIGTCYGGTISDCIINRDVTLSGCIGVTFRNNHLENGAQILLRGSVAEVSDNYIHKGQRPSILIEAHDSAINGSSRRADDESNVIIRNNYFVGITRPGTDVSISKDSIAIKEISPYDIALDKKYGGVFNIRMTANYRYSHNNYGSLQPTGVMLGLVDNSSDVPQITPFEEFNKYSYFLSDECQIHEGFRLDFCREFNQIPQINGGSVMNNEGVPFVNESAFTQDQTIDDSSLNDMGINPGTGTSDEMTPDSYKEVYQYQAQPILDAQRGIAGERWILDVNQDDAVDNQHGNGVLIGLTVTSDSTPCMMRLFKTVTNGKGEYALFYVDIPMVGGRYLYDNGYSVNCYPWIKITGANINPNIILNVLMIKSSNQTGIKRVSFMGDNVKAFGDLSTLPTTAGWKVTDELINYSAGNAGHYCLGDVDGQKKWIKI